MEEYSRRTWKLGKELLKGISESLGLELNYINRKMNLDSGLQMLAANFYPPCPQPELAMGMPPHSDHGLLNLLIQNGVSGLQVLHKGKWINVSSTSNCFLVLVSDHLEVQYVTVSCLMSLSVRIFYYLICRFGFAIDYEQWQVQKCST